MTAGDALMPADAPSSLSVRMRRGLAWTAALTLFLTVGWMAAAPHDPLAPVSLWTHGRPLLMAAQALLLTMIAGAVATVLVGRHLPQAGLFAAALGLAALSLRGETSQYFLINCLAPPASCERALAMRFILEALVWGMILTAAWPVAFIVLAWCGPSPEPRPADRDAPPSPAARRAVLRHVLFVAGLLLVTLAILSSGSSRRAVLHGQTCFTVWASTFLAVWAGQRLVPVSNPWTSLLALPPAILVGYMWSMVTAGSPAAPPTIPSSCFLRLLPLQFIAVGAVAATSALWWLRDDPVPPEDSTVGRAPTSSIPDAPRSRR